MSSQVKVNIVGDASSLTRATKKAQTSLQKLGNTFKGGFSVGAMLGPIAAAASFQALASAVVDSTKVYFEDQKSLQLLNKVIDNNTNATTAQKDAMDETIQSMSLMSATSDDDLRQSMSTLVAGTKNVTKSQELMAIALDTSKATGKDLNTVSIAMSKAYNGNYTALKKLLPGVSASSAAFDEMATAYSGAAAVAGETDPFGQLAVIVEQLQEVIGKQIAPYLQDFVAWFSGSNGQKAIADFSKGVEDITGFFKMIFDAYQTYIWSWYQYVPNLYSVISWLAPDEKALEESQTSTNTLEGISAASTKAVKNLLDGNKQLGGIPKIADRIKQGAKEIQKAGEKWKNSMSFASDVSEDKKFFNAENFMAKMRDVVAAAKALPAKLKALRAAGASPEMLQQVVAMGPQEGLAVAEGFLRTGGAQEYSKSISTLSSLGQQAQANAAGNANYTINVNKANMTADEIIAAIQKFEKKTGRKVAFGG